MTPYKLNIKKKAFFFLLILTLLFSVPFSTYAQTISVDETNHTKEDLVNLLVDDNCIPISNINTSSNQSIAYFNNNGGAFPLSEGIIIRNGIASYTQGPYTDENLSSQINNNGDTVLQSISDSEGQDSSITDVAFLEFNFTSLTNNLSFNYVFASNEYGVWQCGFSDIFAILLTNTATGEVSNLAVLPDSNTNISVRNIRDNQNNSNCTSVNSEFFSTYNVNNPSASTLNMRGHTVSLNASASVTPNTNYKIQFIIGDYNDYRFDSAVFLDAQSFSSSVDLGPDIVNCQGNEVLIDTQLNNNPNFTYEWYFNNNLIPGEITSNLTTSEPGNYNVVVKGIGNDCELTDEIIISNIHTEEPRNLVSCGTSNTYDLTENNSTVLNINTQQYEILYYNSIDNITNNNPIQNNQTTNYNSAGNETIYIKLRNRDTQQFCDVQLSFELLNFDFAISTPDPINACLSDLINIPNNVEDAILNGLNANDYSIRYFLTQESANNNSNPINNPRSYRLPSTLTDPPNIIVIPIFARIEYMNDSNCSQIINFNINVSDRPLVDSLEDVHQCQQYTLPTITNGNYFTGPNGTGTPLNAGDVITESDTIYIYNDDGCSNQSSFYVEIIEEFDLSEFYCGQFTVPQHPTSNFYSASGGPSGNGELLPAGTILTESQTIYFYGEDDEGNFCLEKEFPITINPLPPVDELEDVVTCNSFTLPPLTNGNYFSRPNGTGTSYTAGQQITSTQKIFIYNIDGNGCRISSSFTINIIDTNSFQDTSACGSYTLPNLSFGNYFTEANGSGTIVPEGTVITENQTVYYFAPEVTTSSNCTENISFNIQINSLPEVDSLENIVSCVNALPTLPNLTNGNYFTQPNGGGTQLSAGDTIDSNQTIYIFNTNTLCSAQTSFTVEIRDVPLVDNFTDVFSCEPYTLPTLSNGKFFTQTGGQGQELEAGTLIETTQTIYIYNQIDDLTSCNNENVFEVNILGVNVDEPEDVNACESFVLPPLSVGNYFTETDGGGTQLNAGDVITTTQTLYIYAENGIRFFCSDEHQFTINIFNRPTLNSFENIQGCGSATLLDVSSETIQVDYFRDEALENIIEPSEYNITEIGSQVVFVKSYPKLNPDCFSTNNFQVTVYPLLDLNINSGSICVDYRTGETTNPFLLETNLSSNEYTVNWFFEGQQIATGANYLATEAGVYTVETIKLTPVDGPNCNYNTAEIEVTESKPSFRIENLTSDFSDAYAVEVITIDQGLGEYEYSLDGINFQESSLFNNLAPGEYTVTIRDKTSICGLYTLDFLALKYPKFFTPNFDNINDTWNITDLRNNPEATIEIFNRFGKPIGIIKPSGNGWDGSFNGKRMPSTDYWFIVKYKLNGAFKEFKANFALLRK